jgi:capsule polysaccharide modification protein KpsS
MNDINDDIEEMFSTFDDFTKHVERVYQLELFYGDDTLESVINHSRDVLDEINEYRQKFYLDGEIVDPDLLEDNKEEDFDTEEKEEEQ